MHPHDPDRAAPAGRGRSGGGGPSGPRPFRMPVERRGGHGKYLVLFGLVAIAGLVGQSMFRRWRWTTNGTGRIEVAVNPDDATIVLDGEPPRRSPATMIVHAGGHWLVVERQGYVRIAQRIDVNPGETVEVPVSLMASPPPRALPAPSAMHGRAPAPPTAIRATGVSYVDAKNETVR